MVLRLDDEVGDDQCGENEITIPRKIANLHYAFIQKRIFEKKP